MPKEFSKKQTRKMLATAALLSLLAFGTVMACFPSAIAHTPPWQVPTWAYITAQPNPVGVGQEAFIVFWLAIPPPTAAGVGGDRWQGFRINVTKPDGTVDKLGPYTSDPTGGTYALYTPKTVGTYRFDLSFPGQVLQRNNPQTGVPGSTSDFINDTFLPSTASCTLTVQEQQIAAIPDSPMPSEFWTRPINQLNSNWGSIASNWLGMFQTYRVQDYGSAPNSPHVMWTMPIEFGGMAGGPPGAGYYSGMSYEIRFGNALILQGRLYFKMPLHNNPSGGPYTCIELATGKIIWQRDDINPTFASLYDYESPNQHGVVPSGALYQTSGTTWMAFDPFSGAWIYNFTLVPSGGTQVLESDGTIAKYFLTYNTTSKTGTLSKWTTKAIPEISPNVLNPGTTTDAYQYRVQGKIMNMSANYEYRNVPITQDIVGNQAPSIVFIIPGDIILGRSSNIGTTSTWRGTPDPWTMWAISDKAQNRGQVLWKQNYPAPAGNLTQMLLYQPVDMVNRVITMTYFETGERLGYSLDTGNYMWGPVGTPYQVDHAFQYFSSRAGQNAYGEHIVGGYGGEVFAFDNTDGSLLWKFNDTSHGYESNWGMVPTFPSMMADGKVFAVGGEHSPNVPLYSNERVYAINAVTGEEMWNLTAWASSGLGEAAANMYAADGYLVYVNSYDNQLYCIGRGPSKTTVQAPLNAATKGSSVMITGSVLDQSPGAMNKPAMSDEWMTKWMEYLYMQQQVPGEAVGVTVKLTAIDPNGNPQNIGEVTTDLKGNYGLMWKPPVEGQYTITATFEGSNSYWPSYDTTYLAVDPAASAAPVETQTPAPTTPASTTAAPTVSPSQPVGPGEPTPTALYVAIAAIVIVAVIVATAVILRRRK